MRLNSSKGVISKQKDQRADNRRQVTVEVESVYTGGSEGISKTLLEDYVRQLQQRGEEDSYELLTTREREILQLLVESSADKMNTARAVSPALRALASI